jgi:quinol monooxygenase YgiN
MSFKPEHTEAFKAIFRDNWEKIRSFDGCAHVELLQDEANPSLFFTYSLWKSESHLDAYRQSELFRNVWGGTKILFSERAEAWTVNEVKF